MGGKVRVPTRDAVAKLTAARLAADVMGTPTSSSRAPTPRPPIW
jgi:isocitrate lyase